MKWRGRDDIYIYNLKKKEESEYNGKKKNIFYKNTYQPFCFTHLLRSSVSSASLSKEDSMVTLNFSMYDKSICAIR